jgi:biotin transport system substrate-specific component|tara:strand:- start:331 stop:912 length:582 start_codon:yes stop_codon:yes gene_type:complete
MIIFKPNTSSWVEIIINKLNKNKVFNLTNLSTVLFGSILLIISSKIKIDLYPVPMTLQPLAVLMIAMLYGRNLATATIGVYILQGLLGLPVFAYGGGLMYIFGPTGGFIIGFLISGIVLGELADRGWGKRFITSIVCMLLGLLIIYFFGILQLTLIKGFEYAILKGFYPFLIGDLYKLLIAGILVPYIWKLAK